MITASTTVVAGLDRRGCTVIRRLRCEVPLLVRAVGDPGPVLNLAMVGGAAGPLGGDRLHFHLELEKGARVSIRSVAAAMAQPGPHGEQSELVTEIVVGARATLDWRPQPTVSVMGSNHRTFVRLAADASSTVTMYEGVSLGRLGEPPGRFSLRERVAVGGVAVLDHETSLAPGALLGPGAHGEGRTISTGILIGHDLPAPSATVTKTCLHAIVHLSETCAMVMERR